MLPQSQQSVPNSNTIFMHETSSGSLQEVPSASSNSPSTSMKAPAPRKSRASSSSASSASSTATRTRTIFPKHAVQTLQAWLHANLHHPYLTDESKRQLAYQTGLTTTQVTTWFVNMRRRVVKRMAQGVEQPAESTPCPSFQQPIPPSSSSSMSPWSLPPYPYPVPFYPAVFPPPLDYSVNPSTELYSSMSMLPSVPESNVYLQYQQQYAHAVALLQFQQLQAMSHQQPQLSMWETPSSQQPAPSHSPYVHPFLGFPSWSAMEQPYTRTCPSVVEPYASSPVLESYTSPPMLEPAECSIISVTDQSGTDCSSLTPWSATVSSSTSTDLFHDPLN